MKKIIFVILPILLSSCFWSWDTQDVQEAKKEILNPSSETQTSTGVVEEKVINEDALVTIQKLDTFDIFDLNTLPEDKINAEEIVLTGITWTAAIDSIQVEFSNRESSFLPDTYTLKTFKKGDTTFRYIASSRQKVLDYGANEYLFTAYSGNTKSQIRMTILLQKKEEILVQSWSVDIESEGIKWLSIETRTLDPLDCSIPDNLTSFLSAKYSWVYWNTCRDIIKEKWISYYVLRLSGEEYFYEKHYYDYTSGNYGVLELQTGTGVTKDTIWEKNQELKAMDFPQSAEVDSLFRAKINAVQ